MQSLLRDLVKTWLYRSRTAATAPVNRASQSGLLGSKVSRYVGHIS